MLLSFALVGCNTPAVMVDIDGEVGVQLSVSGDKVVSASVADDDDAAFLTGLSLQKSELKTAVNTIIKAMADKKEMGMDEVLTITVPVTNTGNREGLEVVQLYISDLKSSLPRPLKELKGFQKVRLVPGETKEITFTIAKDALSFYDDAQQIWIAEPGKFEAIVAASATDIKSKVVFNLK